MTNEHFEELSVEFRCVTAGMFSKEELEKKMFSVLEWGNRDKTDEALAKEIGLPVRAISIIRQIKNELCAGESQQKTRLSMHHSMKLNL